MIARTTKETGFLAESVRHNLCIITKTRFLADRP